MDRIGVRNAAPLRPSAEVRITATYGRLVLHRVPPRRPGSNHHRPRQTLAHPSGAVREPVQTGSLRGDLWSTWSIGRLHQVSAGTSGEDNSVAFGCAGRAPLTNIGTATLSSGGGFEACNWTEADKSSGGIELGRLLQRGVAVGCAITSLCVGFVTCVVSTPAEGAPVDALDSISCPSTNVCFAVGLYGTAVGDYGAEGFVVTTTNGGATWTYQTLPSPVSYLSAISCPSTSDCFAAGAETFDTGIVASVILTTTDGGRTWTPRGFPDQFSGMPVSIACYSTSICYLAGKFC